MPSATFSTDDLEQARQLLTSLGRAVLARVLELRGDPRMADIHARTDADTIYRIDHLTEGTITDWFAANWPAHWPVEVVVEGAASPLTFPAGTAVADTAWKLILDPIDGTRLIMHDKRSAWSLAAMAPQRGPQTCLTDLLVGAMTELPTTKGWRADQVSGWRHPDGRQSLVTKGIDVFSGVHYPLRQSPSRATSFAHGFAGLTKFFVEGRVAVAEVEDALWRMLELYGGGQSPRVFDDQYLSTGGQIHELLCGHDLMNGDLRPLALARAGVPDSIACHPYDIGPGFLLELAGGILCGLDGQPLRAPLDTTTPVAWLGFANRSLADQVLAVLPALLEGSRKGD